MLIELFALAILVVFGIVYLGTFKGKSSLPLLIAAGCIALVAGMYLGAEGISSSSETPQLWFSDELSNYWDCDKLVNHCTGTPDFGACTAYNEEQCNDIADCVWNGYPDNCTGNVKQTCAWLGGYDTLNPGLKCQETQGCTWAATLETATCDRVVVFYNYTNSTGVTTPVRNDNYTLIISLMTIMFGLYLILGPIAARFLGKRNDDDDLEGEGSDDGEGE
jgi:hypothetical protein